MSTDRIIDNAVADVSGLTPGGSCRVVDVERAGYDTLKKDQADRILRWNAKVARHNRMKEELIALYALAFDLTAASREALSPEMKLLVKRACAIVRRVEEG